MKANVCHRARGQSSVEFLVVCAALVGILLVPVNGKGENAAQALAGSVRSFFQAYSYFLSLP